MKHEMVTRVEDITFRYSHHREAVKEAGIHLLGEGGSYRAGIWRLRGKAYGAARFDIDAMVVVTDDFYAKAKEENCTAGMIPMGDCAYPGGYFDYKYMTKDFIRDAAEKASEPTRNSFIGSHVMFSGGSGGHGTGIKDPGIPGAGVRGTRCSPSSVICSSTISISGKSADRKDI